MSTEGSSMLLSIQYSTGNSTSTRCAFVKKLDFAQRLKSSISGKSSLSKVAKLDFGQKLVFVVTPVNLPPRIQTENYLLIFQSSERLQSFDQIVFNS